MSYADAIKFLYSLRWFGAKFGLENTRKLAALAGNPQDDLRFIHVAGTNGKGSTCAILESICRAAGLRVGLFTSPHLVVFCERIQVNRRLIPEEEVARLVSQILPWLTQFPRDEHPTFFEVITVMALLYFRSQKCDLVVWETGLGGRLDATNIVTPIASVITNIQYDHQKYLGDTLGEIAFEKAGIIKPNVPVITATEAAEAFDVIRARAGELQAPLTRVTPAEAHLPPLDSVTLPLLGEHQRTNAALALATVRVLDSLLPCDENAIRSGLSQVYWPGRLQLATLGSGQKVLLDGAHNLGGVETLVAALKTYFPDKKPALILGILQDKDWTHMCQALAPLAEAILLVPVESERTVQPHGLAEVCGSANPQATIFECDSFREALSKASRYPFLTVAGSLYLVGEALEAFQLSPVKTTEERGLNEWSVR